MTWINPHSTEGAAIITLFRRIKDLEQDDPDRSWPGADVVDELVSWFPTVGIDPEQDPDTVVDRLHSAPHPYTLFGLRDNDSGHTLVAAVAAGDIRCVDADPGTEHGYQRVAESVIASSASEAEESFRSLADGDLTDAPIEDLNN